MGYPAGVRVAFPVLLASAALGVGCGPSPSAGAGSGETVETGMDPAAEVIPTDPYAESDVLFGLARVHTVDVEVDASGLLALVGAPREYVPATLTFDGEVVPEVGFRLKGSGSFQSLDGKAAFKIDIDRYLPGAELHGLSKLTFNNMLHDTSQVHEVVAWSVVRAVGLPFLRVGYAWVTVNGEPYGLYAHVESPDGGWMARTLATTEGRIYEGGYPQYPDSYAHADFEGSDATNFDLEVGEGDAHAEIVAATAAIAGEDDATWDAEVSPLVDLDQYALFQITEAWVGQWDGYAYARASNNYRIWVDVGGDGRIRFIPSGLDYCFTDYAMNWARSRSPVGKPCRQSDVCRQRLADAAAHVADTVDPSELIALRGEAWALIEPFVEEDPRRIYTVASIRNDQDNVDDWLLRRSDEILDWYGD